MSRSDVDHRASLSSRDQACRHAFERRPGGDQLDHLVLGLAHHIDAAARHRAHETLALELRHRLADRRAADAEILRQLALVEPDVAAAAIDVHRHDDILQRRIGLVLETERGVDRLDRKPMGFTLRPWAASPKSRNLGRVRNSCRTARGALVYNIPEPGSQSASPPYAVRLRQSENRIRPIRPFGRPAAAYSRS